MRPAGIVREEVRRGELVATPIVEPVIDRTIYVAQASDRPASPATTATSSWYCSNTFASTGAS
jgi:hypothetical protein